MKQEIKLIFWRETAPVRRRRFLLLGLAEVHSDRVHGAGGCNAGSGGTRRERKEDNEVEVNDITVHFEGEGRRRVE